MSEQIHRLSLLLSRLFAFGIDLLIISILLYLNSSLILKAIENDPVKVVFQIILFFEFYFLLFELIARRTPGKFLFGLRVVTDFDNAHIFSFRKMILSLFEIIKRNLLRVILYLPPLFIWNEILVLIFMKGRTISDLLTKSKIIFNRPDN